MENSEVTKKPDVGKEKPGSDRLLEQLKDTTEINKDYTKYIIGLSTGILVLTTAFLSRQAQFTAYKWVIVIGWISLTVSIVLGLWIIKRSNMAVICFPEFFRLGKPEDIAKKITKSYDFPITKELIQILFKKYDSELGKLTSDKVSEFAKDVGFRKQFRDLCLKLIKKAPKQIINFIKESFKLEDMLAKMGENGTFSAGVTLPTAVKETRKSLFVLTYIPKYFEAAFFVGLFFVCLFFVLNFLK